MFDFEPGPIEHEDFPLGPRVTGGQAFEGMAADYLDARAGADGALSLVANDVTEDGAPDLDSAYAYQVAPAEETHGANVNDPTPSPAPELAANGEDVNARAAEVAPNLPDPDSGVPLDFADPPSVDLNAYMATTPPPPQYQNPDNPSEDTEV